MDDNHNIKRFNEGYDLARLDNDLANSLMGSIEKDASEDMQLFKEGVLQFEKDKFIERTKDQSPDLEMGRDVE